MAESKFQKAGDKLRELRKETGLSLFKVAKKTHISGNYLSLLERGKQSPSDTVIYNLAEFYNIPSSELFNLYDKIEPSEKIDLLNMPTDLRQILTQLSVDKKLTSEEKTKIANEVHKLVNELLLEDGD